jgi:endoglucanase
VVAKKALIVFLTSVLCALGGGQIAAEPLKLTGVSLAGAEFGNMPGQAGKDYFYPSQSDVNELLLRGVGVFRLPFRWERLQRDLNGPLDPDESARMVSAVEAMTSKGARVIVSPHNFGRYNDKTIGSPEVPSAAFAKFWGELAVLFRDNSLVIFGLMNEPHDMPTEQWRDAANEAIAAIRAVGASNLLLVPGNAWTGGQSWASSEYGTPNAIAMAAVHDPLDNFAYEIHQYFDADYSGTHAVCEHADIGVQALKGVTDWLKSQKRRAFLAEFASTVDATCLQAMDNTLYYVEDHPDAWFGWTYWAAGSWWGQHPLSAQPTPNGDPPQLQTLLTHIRAY